jgi:nucleoside-diphosphate-sugar epimerase
VVTIDQLAGMVMKIAGKKLSINLTEGPQEVRDKHSDNLFIAEKLGWKLQESLNEGLRKMFPWVKEQVKQGVVGQSPGV